MVECPWALLVFSLSVEVSVTSDIAVLGNVVCAIRCVDTVEVGDKCSADDVTTLVNGDIMAVKDDVRTGCEDVAAAGGKAEIAVGDASECADNPPSPMDNVKSAWTDAMCDMSLAVNEVIITLDSVIVVVVDVDRC